MKPNIKPVMMKSVLIAVVGLVISFSSFAQERQYFSMFFQARADKKTPYVRTYKKEDNKWLTEDFKNDTLVLSGVITGTTDSSVADDLIKYIRADVQETMYKSSFKKLSGQFVYYYGTGKRGSEIVFSENKMRYVQLWTAEGQEQLINGSGIYKCFSDENDVDVFQEYKDSVMVSGYSVRRAKGDTIYAKVDKQAAPKEGIPEFYKNLVGVLKYPAVARFVGKEGRVFVAFIVDEHGKLTDFSPKTKEGYKFETKVIKQLGKLPDWNPAVYKGRFVKQGFILPINYKLK